MRKIIFVLAFLAFHFHLFSQVLDFNIVYKSAIELYSKGNYSGAKVRFTIAQRKASKERNYTGQQNCRDYVINSDRCAEMLTDGDRYYSKGEFEGAKKYYEGINELNPKDPNNVERSLKCRNEVDYLATKKQADAFFTNGDWDQANVLYNICMDSSKSELISYKRYHKDVEMRDKECLEKINMFNTDSLKMKAKKLLDKFNKKPKKEEKEPQKKDTHGFLLQEETPKNKMGWRRVDFGLLAERRRNTTLIINWWNA